MVGWEFIKNEFPFVGVNEMERNQMNEMKSNEMK